MSKAKYIVVGVVPGTVRFNGHTYDLSKLDGISEKTKKALAEDPKFPFLAVEEKATGSGSSN